MITTYITTSREMLKKGIKLKTDYKITIKKNYQESKITNHVKLLLHLSKIFPVLFNRIKNSF